MGSFVVVVWFLLLRAGKETSAKWDLRFGGYCVSQTEKKKEKSEEKTRCFHFPN